MSEKNETKKQDTGACGPGCACGTSGKNGSGKAIGIAVLVVVCALVARAIVKSQGAAEKPQTTAGFTGLPAAEPSSETAGVTVPENVPAEPTATKDNVAAASAEPAVVKASSGGASAEQAITNALGDASSEQSVTNALKEIGAIMELNQLAMGSKGVFLYVAAKGPTDSKAPMESMLGAARKIEPQAGGTIGMFALKVGSPDYEMIASQLTVPGVIVLVPGGRMVPVTGEITETKLIQGFLSSVKSCGAGGCGPKGCG